MPLLLLMVSGAAWRWPVAMMGFVAIERGFTGFVGPMIWGHAVSGQGYILVDFLPMLIAYYRTYESLKLDPINKRTKVVAIAWLVYTLYALLSLLWSPASQTWYAKDPRSVLINVMITMPLYIIGLSSIKRFREFSWGVIAHVLITHTLFIIAYAIPAFNVLLNSRGSLVGTQPHRALIPLVIAIPLVYGLTKRPAVRIYSVLFLNIVTFFQIFFDSGRIAFIMLFFSQFLIMKVPMAISGGVFAATGYQVLSNSDIFSGQWQKYRLLGIIDPSLRDMGFEYRFSTIRIFFERFFDIPFISGFGAYSFGMEGWGGSWGTGTMHNGILEIYWDFGLIGVVLASFSIIAIIRASRNVFLYNKSEYHYISKVSLAVGISILLFTWVTGSSVVGQPFIAGLFCALWSDPDIHKKKTNIQQQLPISRKFNKDNFL